MFQRITDQRTNRQSQQHELHPLPDYEPNDLATCAPNAIRMPISFVRWLDGIRQHAEEPDGREYEREYAEETQQARI